jgi:hypothetical protein
VVVVEPRVGPKKRALRAAWDAHWSPRARLMMAQGSWRPETVRV